METTYQTSKPNTITNGQRPSDSRYCGATHCLRAQPISDVRPSEEAHTTSRRSRRERACMRCGRSGSLRAFVRGVVDGRRDRRAVHNGGRDGILEATDLLRQRAVLSPVWLPDQRFVRRLAATNVGSRYRRPRHLAGAQLSSSLALIHRMQSHHFRKTQIEHGQ
jgi:hypothetical protein